jgi:hypothetical protein
MLMMTNGKTGSNVTQDELNSVVDVVVRVCRASNPAHTVVSMKRETVELFLTRALRESGFAFTVV